MLSDDGLQNLLWQEFILHNLIPSPERYEVSRQEISRFGITEREHVMNYVGRNTWRRTLARFERPYAEDDCIRILGFGYALTEFAIAPLDIAPHQRKAISSLGALANLIVSTFDQLVDLGYSSRLLLPRPMLELATRSKWRTPLTAVGLISPAASRMMSKLVTHYFRELERLPYAGEHTEIHKGIKRTILRMYDVEIKTLKREKNLISERALRRKAALPFVVMGLPAWLGMEEICRRRYWWHLRWLYKLGEFFGWIDDLVDRHEDLAKAHPNRLLNIRTRLQGDFEENTNLARLIARRGDWIVREWDRQVNPNNLPSIVRESFYTCLVSWLGGMKS